MIETNTSHNEEEYKEEYESEHEGITDKEFQRAMQKLKNRGSNAVPPKKSASAYIIFGKEVCLNLIYFLNISISILIFSCIPNSY